MKVLRLSCVCGGYLESEEPTQAELEGLFSFLVLFLQNHECKFDPNGTPLPMHAATLQSFHPLDPEGH